MERVDSFVTGGSDARHKLLDDEVCSCLLILIEPIHLLVPRTLIAEVIQLNANVTKASQSPDIEVVDWRGSQIPVLKPHLINPLCKGEANEDSKLLIFHGLLNHQKLPFFALPASRNPRLTQVSPASIVNDDSISELNAGELQAVQVNAEAAVIPNVDFLENFILNNY